MARDDKGKTYYESREGFSDKVRKVQKEGFGGRVSPTGYTDTLIGMDDLDKLRRVKLNRKVNG